MSDVIKLKSGTGNESNTYDTPGIPLKKVILIFLLTILAGSLTGFAVSEGTKLTASKDTATGKKKSSSKAKEVVGIKDKKTFKDTATGILKEGGIEGVGEYHLERPGGDDQTAYLTSTTVDLSKYLGKKVNVWGETFYSETAGWFMDVGLVEVLN